VWRTADRRRSIEPRDEDEQRRMRRRLRSQPDYDPSSDSADWQCIFTGAGGNGSGGAIRGITMPGIGLGQPATNTLPAPYACHLGRCFCTGKTNCASMLARRSAPRSTAAPTARTATTAQAAGAP